MENRNDEFIEFGMSLKKIFKGCSNDYNDMFYLGMCHSKM